MSLKETTAQELVVIDPGAFEELQHEHMMPVEISLEEPVESHLEISDHPMEVDEIVVSLSDLPGAPPGTKHPEPEPEIEVEEKPAKDTNDAKKNNKWDWKSPTTEQFMTNVKNLLDNVPKHSGFDVAGCRRAISYLDRVDDMISSRMQNDVDGELDADKIEKIRAKIDEGKGQLLDRVDAIDNKSKSKRKKKADFEDAALIKEAQKITGVKGTFVTVPLLIAGIGRICINGHISAGHDIEKIYADQVKKWKLNDREKAEVRWFLFDMGYPLRGDRGFMPEEDFDPTSSDNYHYSAQYQS